MELEEPYREVFAMHVFGEVPLKEIAAEHGKSESWARVTYLRASKQKSWWRSIWPVVTDAAGILRKCICRRTWFRKKLFWRYRRRRPVQRRKAYGEAFGRLGEDGRCHCW